MSDNYFLEIKTKNMAQNGTYLHVFEALLLAWPEGSRPA